MLNRPNRDWSPVFSALRAYALSNKSVWFAIITIVLVLPPVVMRIVSASLQIVGLAVVAEPFWGKGPNGLLNSRESTEPFKL